MKHYAYIMLPVLMLFIQCNRTLVNSSKPPKEEVVSKSSVFFPAAKQNDTTLYIANLSLETNRHATRIFSHLATVRIYCQEDDFAYFTVHYEGPHWSERIAVPIDSFDLSFSGKLSVKEDIITLSDNPVEGTLNWIPATEIEGLPSGTISVPIHLKSTTDEITNNLERLEIQTTLLGKDWIIHLADLTANLDEAAFDMAQPDVEVPDYIYIEYTNTTGHSVYITAVGTGGSDSIYPGWAVDVPPGETKRIKADEYTIDQLNDYLKFTFDDGRQLVLESIHNNLDKRYEYDGFIPELSRHFAISTAWFEIIISTELTASYRIDDNLYQRAK